LAINKRMENGAVWSRGDYLGPAFGLIS